MTVEHSGGQGASRAPTTGMARLFWLVLLGASLAGLGTAIWSLSDGMRAVMEVGGSCGNDPEYAVYQPCPDGVARDVLVGIFGGMLAAGMSVVAAWRGRAPQLAIAAWPALFGVLGWNFLEYGWGGSLGPEGSTSPADSGLLFCGLLFEAFALIPTLLVLYFATAGRVRMLRVRQSFAAAASRVSLVK